MNVTTVAVGGVDLVVREWGRESERSLFFWPSLSPWGALHLVELAPLLAARGFHVVSISPPGAGETPTLEDAEAYRPTRLAQLLLETADSLGVDRFVYMGASWGASIGVHLGARWPERVAALILLDAGHTDVTTEQTRTELEALWEADQEQFSFENWDAYFEWVRSRVRVWRPALEERYRLAMVEHEGRVVPRADARAGARAFHGVAAEPPTSTHARLGELGVPILLLLAADGDRTDAAKRFQAAVPQATLLVLDAGHDIVEDQPEQTAAIVTEWLAQRKSW